MEDKELKKLIESVEALNTQILSSYNVFEKEFKDEDTHHYSPFILWSEDEIKSLQPDLETDLSGFLAIGSNGGMETYLLCHKTKAIYVCDLISGAKSLKKVASSYEELLTLLS